MIVKISTSIIISVKNILTLPSTINHIGTFFSILQLFIFCEPLKKNFNKNILNLAFDTL